MAGRSGGQTLRWLYWQAETRNRRMISTGAYLKPLRRGEKSSLGERDDPGGLYAGDRGDNKRLIC